MVDTSEDLDSSAATSEPVRTTASDVSVMLTPLQGEGYTARDWLTAYPFLLVALDPYTHESAWILDTAVAILEHYRPSDVRVGWLVAADAEGCREFLGPLAEDFLTFADPDRVAIKNFGIQRLPALFNIFGDTSTQVANGWNPTTWRQVTEQLSLQLHWSRPLIPSPGDPLPYQGTPASG